MKTRRSCQKCRYDLCLEAGMKSDAVMRDDEKQQRFKKSILKKQRVAQARKKNIQLRGKCLSLRGFGWIDLYRDYLEEMYVIC